jgi:hypothetical protein
MGLVLLILLVLLLFGAMPRLELQPELGLWTQWDSGVILIVVVVLLLTGRL